ncbi:HAMP domain-containing protein [Streptomyces sp. GMY01]|uniref:sensor histidine kinase n=1 Tax=Streptomyces sp. GMY02 TaxID=1333528 RepID=UPI00146A1B4A|nr:nitrate- and nitrite sensing domain-containing protein [Streptomyces sp. GMY02]NMO32538.1 HAMP domain-containing protein [Streptomyces sp. GMY02]
MQGRFKRDGSASAEPEPHGGTGPMAVSSSPQHAQNQGPAASGDSKERGGTAGPTPPSGPAPSVKPAKGAASTGPGSRMALRNWRISTRLVSLLALPVVAATTLGGLRINQNLDDIQQLDNMKLLTDMTKQATELAAALQEERDQSAGPLAHPSSASAITVKGFRDKTDRAKDNFLTASEEIDSASKDGNLQGVRDTLVGLASELNGLAKIRKSAYTSERNSAQTVEAYHHLITELLGLSQDMAEATSNPEMIQRTRALAAFSSAKEYASVQRAVIAAALPANNTSKADLSDNDRLYAQSALDSQTSEINSFRNIYGSGAEELLKPVEEGNPTIQSADQYAKRALDSADGLASLNKRSYRDWVDDSSTKIEQMRKIEHTLLENMEQKARELRSSTEQDAIISGVLILLVLGVSLVGAFVVARSMIRSLRRLQDTATRVAQDRLPELVKQLSESDPQDVDTTVESVGVHSRDEIGQVAAAFDEVHREAVRLAAEQALLRGNVNAMFTNLSRRSQGLIQRQLSLISELESREADPDQLSSLFKLDHLATRMRRNGENLLVLAGEEPGRRWTRPVPLVDVLRAAASEVEQYERIELASVPTTEVAGRVVNDLVHLLAELLENATSFSSPQTKVKVTGHALPDGRVLIEIHDTGIGLSPEDLAAINERLASPPTVDVSVSRRMGLFVVGRLSQRHGIRIQLRPSDSGGTTALVMLPVDVAQGGKKPAPGKPGASAGGPAAAAAAAGAAAARRQSGQAAGGALGAGGAGRLGPGAAQRGQVGAGQGPRAALPGTGGRPGGPGGPGGAGGARGPQGGPGQPQQGRPGQNGPGPNNGQNGPGQSPAGAGAGFGGRAPGAPQGLQAAGPAAPQGFGDGRRANNANPRQGFGEGGRQDAFGNGARGGVPPQRGNGGEQGRTPQLPPRGGPRAELPGGNPQPRTPSWGNENAAGPARPDAPRGHDEAERAQNAPRYEDHSGPGGTAEMPALPAPDRQGQGGPADTSAFPRPDFDAPQGGGRNAGRFQDPAAGGQQNTGSFVRPDIFGGGAQGGQQHGGPSDTGQFAAPQGYDNGSTGQFQQPGYDDGATGQFPAVQGYDDGSTGQFPAVQGYDDGSTGQFRQPGYDNSSTGQFQQPGHDNGATGQYATPQAYDNGATGQFQQPAQHDGNFGRPQLPGRQDPSSTGQFERPQAAGGPADFGAPRPPAQAQRPVAREPEALPPAGPGDGRTPLFDTLETNWFRGERQQAATPAPAPQQPQAPAAPERPAASAWRSSPNDELVRQAERVRQPAAGGVTTSGLPRRVPKANLVPGTAQQQQHQSGPQVSRAPDDVRGRLTNLRRGIAQGRQAGNGQTGSHPSPTHQQER